MRAKDFGDLPERLARLAGERIFFDIFEKEGLPLAVSAMPSAPMPLRAMMGLFSRSALALDNRTLGIDVGERMTQKGYGAVDRTFRRGRHARRGPGARRHHQLGSANRLAHGARR